ncbi:MAG TPA: hypothetical protein VNO30_33260 [Kofleriaceae bacterium]|nr:hypothetical protein [Kofleriaceae bacterium]
MGAVWLAEHTVAQRSRCCTQSNSSNSDLVTRFFNEARAATTVNDPGIAQIFDFGRHSDGSTAEKG